MRYVALLRGINVGGKSKVEMSKLREAFEGAGFINVSTYINSGNVIFSSEETNIATLTSSIEETIAATFKLSIPVLVLDLPSLESVIEALPDSWTNDKVMKCDVLFLWDNIDSPKVIEDFVIQPEHEDLLYVPGALIWRVDRSHQSKSKMIRLIGTDVYKKLTVRNCNTVRKLFSLMAAAN